MPVCSGRLDNHPSFSQVGSTVLICKPNIALKRRALNNRRKCWLFTEKPMAVVEWQCFEEWQTLTKEGFQSLISRFRFVRLVPCGTQLPPMQQTWPTILHDATSCERELKRSNQRTSNVPSLCIFEGPKKVANLETTTQPMASEQAQTERYPPSGDFSYI